MTHLTRLFSRRAIACVASVVLTLIGLGAEPAKIHFDLPSDSAARSLKQFSTQSGTEVLYSTDLAADVKTNAVIGDFTPREALDKLLTGTPLVAAQNAKTGAFTLSRASAPNAPRAALAKNSDRPSENNSTNEKTVELPAFEVFGSKLLNMDIKRSRDDAQPYVIFERSKIEQSGATSIEDFLKQRLTMNSSAMTTSQVASFNGGNISAINLRGLGANQTLILIDGHRAAGPLTSTTLGTPGQTDLNGIPLAAIERIEILPTTASGIYGGTATGGVINVILRRDYAGAEVKVAYENTFSTDSRARRIDFGAGFTLEHGKTHVLVAGSYLDQNELRVEDRDFVQRGRAAIIANTGGDPSALNVASVNPPLGTTANIRSVSGAPLFGVGTPNFTYAPVGYTGGLVPLQANAGHYNLALAPTAQASVGAGSGGRQSLVSTPKTESLTATIRRQFGAHVLGFLEISANNNTSVGWSNSAGTTGFQVPVGANNPFGQAVRVVVPIAQADSPTVVASYDRRIMGGAIVELSRDWKAELSYIWDRSRYFNLNSLNVTAAVTTAVTNGTVNLLRDPALIDFSPYLAPPTYTPPAYSTMNNADLRLSGRVGSVPAGPIGVSALMEFRDERVGEGFQIGATSTTYSPPRNRTLGGIYLETNVPLVSACISRPGVKSLELQLAGRADDYVLHGANQITIPTPVVPANAPILHATNKATAFNPTVGLKYRPFDSLTLRASYGTGFLPPSLSQLVPNSAVTQPALTTTDPRRGNTAIAAGVQSVTGGNPNLRPEHSESWSVGAIFNPLFAQGLRLSIDYTRITKNDNIASLSLAQVVENESILAGRVTRGANLPGDQPGWAGPITGINLTSVNISKASVEAYDVALDYRVDAISGGYVDAFLAATWQPHYTTQLIATAPSLENAGVGGALASVPLKFRANAGLTLHRNAWTLGWTARYFDSYLVASPSLSTSLATYQRQGGTTVSRQIYHDIFASYRFQPDRTRLRDTTVQVGIRNIFNREPPFDVANLFHFYSAFGDPRLASYYVSVKRLF